MIIQEIKLKNYPYKSRRGLSEKLAKNLFVKNGYEVFRSVMIFGKEFSVNYNLYENVKKKYDRLEEILINRFNIDFIRQKIKSRKGLPDYLIFKDNIFLFVEVKLEHEQIKKHQLQCMKLLEELNFNVMILRIKSKPFRLKSIVDLNNGLNLSNKRVLEQQKKIKLHYK
jgi:hypothetical protein